MEPPRWPVASRRSCAASCPGLATHPAGLSPRMSRWSRKPARKQRGPWPAPWLACVAWLVGGAVEGVSDATARPRFSGWRASIRKRQRHGAREADEHKRRERENQAPRLKCLHRQAGRPRLSFGRRGPLRIARGGFSDRLATRRWGRIVSRLRQLTVDTPVTGANPAQMLFELLNARTKLLLIKQLSHALTLR